MSVINDFLVNGLNPSTVGGSGTAVKYFPRLLGNSIGVQSVAPSATSSAGQLVVNGNNALNGQWFTIRVGAGLIGGAADSSVTAKLSVYANTAAIGAAPSYTEIATTGLFTQPLELSELEVGLNVALFGTTGSGIVRGIQNGVYGANNLAAGALTNNLSGISFAGQAPFGLVVGVTFSSSDASNSAKLYQFQLTAE
jgi:hypothetical protein